MFQFNRSNAFYDSYFTNSEAHEYEIIYQIISFSNPDLDDIIARNLVTFDYLTLGENRISTENAFICDYFGNGANNELDNVPKILFQVLLEILDVSSNL